MQIQFEVFYYSTVDVDTLNDTDYPAYKSTTATVDVPNLKSIDDLPYITSEEEQYIESKFNDLIDDLGELESYLPVE